MRGALVHIPQSLFDVPETFAGRKDWLDRAMRAWDVLVSSSPSHPVQDRSPVRSSGPRPAPRRHNVRMKACAACRAVLPDGARFCPSCGARIPDLPPVAERKLATCLFADLVGSTELAGTQDPEKTRMLLDRFYDGMAAEIGAAGGTIEKFAGDAVLAVFGVPTAQEDHAHRALRAALSMRERLRTLFGDRVKLRIGVNSGEVAVGTPRSGSSFVSGDPRERRGAGRAGGRGRRDPGGRADRRRGAIRVRVRSEAHHPGEREA